MIGVLLVAGAVAVALAYQLGYRSGEIDGARRMDDLARREQQVSSAMTVNGVVRAKAPSPTGRRHRKATGVPRRQKRRRPTNAELLEQRPEASR